LEFVVRPVDIEDTTIARIGERHHGDLDDLIFGRIKSRRFQIEKDSEFCVAAVRLMVSRWRLKAAEYAIIASLFQFPGDFIVVINWVCSQDAAGTSRDRLSDPHHDRALA
jgi:hypothetical protein